MNENASTPHPGGKDAQDVIMELPEPYRVAHYLRRGRFRLATHYHSFWQFIYVLSGRLELSAGGEKASMGAGRFCALRPGVPHALSSPEGYCQLGVDVLDLPDGRGVVAQLDEAFSGDFTVVSLPDFHLGVEELRRRMLKFTALDRLAVTNVAEGLLLRAAEAAGGEENLPFVDRFLQLMEGADAHLLTLGEICRRMGMSKTHLERLVREQFGCGAVSYANKLRISRACALLQTTDLTVRAVAEALGFYDESHFNGFFKRQMGVTPGTYRRESRQLPG